MIRSVECNGIEAAEEQNRSMAVQVVKFHVPLGALQNTSPKVRGGLPMYVAHERLYLTAQ